MSQSWRGVGWEVGYEHLADHLQAGGSPTVAGSFVCDDGFRLGSWLNTQRSWKRAGRLSEQRIQMLDDLGVVWDPQATSRKSNLTLIRAFGEENGHINVPVMHRSPSGKPIGKWLQMQIEAFHSQRLSEEIRVELERMGVDWSHGRRDPFAEAVDELRIFIQETGDTHVPSSYVSPSGFKLGRWYTKQKSFLKKGTLTPERVKQLTGLGVSVDRDVRDEAWLEGFRQLRAYRDANGDARVPSHFETEEGYPLGPWRRTQRGMLADGRLRDDRRTLLDNLDPTWNESRPTGWSREEGLSALSEAATLAYPLSSGTYEELRSQGAFVGPGTGWFAHHFDSWAHACESAGVDGGSDKSGSFFYSDSELADSAKRFFREMGASGSSRAYSEWVVHRPGHPSAGSIIRRFGSWPAVRDRFAEDCQGT
ncbi:hypothetical protein AFL01nite_13300 [Aeromicrobium flavum]|uniref:Helicase-associated domain-containing protein n=1 Tax=Aeromicrobium flavum TaxID=416568 RepID=A0A512HU74_9ACTN|nr:helicase associated domain-containing protein [Aeromicrobium flavum]GEO89003.1 hypothetical protein AFL01nite_13300 [Aeromicrobium flavum]